MNLLSGEEVKRKEVEILNHIVAVCEKHGLRYYLSYGTLLGAIRHKGFIPWDDDIDISMPRADYEQLLKVMLANPDKRFVALTPKIKRLPLPLRQSGGPQHQTGGGKPRRLRRQRPVG